MIVPFFSLALLAFLGSNILLQTALVRGWVEHRLERRSGFAWTVGHLSWTPWSGIQIGGVQAELRGLPEIDQPVFRAERLDVQPYWSEVVRGKVSVREVRVSGMKGAIPLELLALASGPATAPAPEKQSTEKPPPAGPAGEEPRRPAKPQPKRPTGEGAKRPRQKPPSQSGKKKPVSPPSPKPEEPAQPEAREVPMPALSTRIRIVEGEIVLYSLQSPGRRVVLSGVTADVPLSGEASAGSWSATALKLGDTVVAGPFASALEWNATLLTLPKSEFQWQGLTVVAEGAFRPRGAPVFSLAMKIAPGGLETTDLGTRTGVAVQAGSVEGSGTLRGNLLQPRSWKGDLQLKAHEVVLTQRDRHRSIFFDEGSVGAVLDGGNLRVGDLRLVGERLSFLGNGLVLSDGRMVAVLRVVADPEHAGTITRIANGSLLTGGWTRAWLFPLETADRRFRDINLIGTVQKATVDVGRRGESVPVELALERMAAFIKRERAEEQTVLAPAEAEEGDLQLLPAQ